nr:hypothetical protein [Gemmatimonadaceae bacterium]
MNGRPHAEEGHAPSIIERIVRDHAEQAALAWDRRDRMRWHPAYQADDVAAVEALLEDHLDGLTVAGPDAEQIVSGLLEHHPSVGDIMVATTFAMQHDALALLGRIEDTLRGHPAGAGGAAAALLRAAPDRGSRVATRWRSSDVPALRRAALSADIARRSEKAIDHVRYCLRDPSPLVRARAWRAAARFALPVETARSPHVDDPGERAALRLWTLATDRAASVGRDDEMFTALGMRDTLRLLTQYGARLQASTASAWAARWRGHAHLGWYAPFVLALQGDATHVDELLAWLDDDRLNPAAGAAIAHLTGVDAVVERVLGVDVAMADRGTTPRSTLQPDDLFGPFDELPCWMGAATRQWWSARGRAQCPSVRVLAGRPWAVAIDMEACSGTAL